MYRATFAMQLTVAACASATLLVAQSATPANSLPPGFVDGRVSPTSVPDYAAYRLVLIHLGSSKASDPRVPQREQAKYARIGLSPADTAALKGLVQTFITSYGQWQAQVGPSVSAVAEQQAISMALATRDAIFKALTPDGISKFAAYVQQEKRHMIVRP